MKKTILNLYLYGIFVFIFIFANLFLSFAFVSASMTIGNPSDNIDKSYAPGDSLRGWINISLSNEESNNLVEDLKGNSISILELIKNSSYSVNYTCDNLKCITEYSSSNPETSKINDFPEDSYTIVGAKIIGNLSADGVTYFNLTIQSDAAPSCQNQISVDMLDDGIIDAENSKVSNSACSSTKDFGCYNPSVSQTEAKLNEIPYCEEVSIQKAPGYEIGAHLRRVGSSKHVTMMLFELNKTSPTATCDLLDKTGPSEAEESCVINYPLKEGKYFACIMSTDGSVEYFIKGYQDANSCGFHEAPNGHNALPYTYSIFVQSKKYDNVGKISLENNDLLAKWTIGTLYNQYIKNKYGSWDCTNGCIIPIKIISNTQQKIIIENFKINYDTLGFGEKTDNQLYDLEEKPALMTTSSFQKISIDKGGFLVSNNYGTESVSLSLNGNQIFNEQITVKQVPTPNVLSPMNVPAGLPSDFVVLYSPSDTNVTSYYWEFGDSQTQTTQTNTVTHTYNTIGNFNMKVTITNTEQEKGSNIFNITVGSPKEFVNSTLYNKIHDLDNIKTQINKNFTEFYQIQIKNELDITHMESEIKRIQETYSKAGNNNDTYIQLMKDLVALKIPQEIVITKSADSVKFYPLDEDIDFEIFKQIDDSGVNYTNENNDFSNLVSNWYMRNMQTKITFKEVSGRYNSEIDPILSTFELQVSRQKDFDYNVLFFMKQLEGLKFSGDYSQRNISDYIYFPIKNKNENIIFVTTEKVDFTNLPMFISPTLNQLGIQEPVQPKNTTPIWIWFAVVLGALLLITLIVYIILQKWYKRNYENILFPNRNEFYNLAAFIENAKKNNQKDSEIEDKLKKASWSREQIRYVMKKYAGKNAGMAELPFQGKKPAQKPGNLATVNKKNIYRKL